MNTLAKLNLLLVLASTAVTAAAQTTILIPESQLERLREDTHPWNRATGGFRDNHNYTLGLAYESGAWTTNAWNEFSAQAQDSQGLQLMFGYAFYIPWSKALGLGYFVGSRLRAISRRDLTQTGFANRTAFGLPGAHAGLVWELNARFRTQIGIEIWPIRIEKFILKQDDKQARFSTTAEVYSRQLRVDYFFRLDRAVYLEFEKFNFSAERPQGLKLSRDASNIGLGMVWHEL